MQWILRTAAVAIMTAAIALPVTAQKTPKGKGSDAPTCGDHGTTITFAANVKEAAKQAEKEQKLVLAIHISGYFEDSEYT